MAISVGEGGGDETPMSDINTTPLVDVMLVLLIIFLIAIPVVIQSVDIKLPKQAFEVTQTKPENVSLTVREKGGQCEVYWGMAPVSSNQLYDRAVQKLKDEVERAGGLAVVKPDDLPEVHIRGDINTPYRCIGGTIFTMQRAGFVKVGFISEPEPGAATVRL